MYLATLVVFATTEGFLWDDLRKVFRGGQRVAKVPNAVEILLKITTACTLQTDDSRQTDGQQHSERDSELTIAKMFRPVFVSSKT